MVAEAKKLQNRDKHIFCGLDYYATENRAMEYDPEKHHRRSIRLQYYDYSRCGAYFITICTQEHLCLIGDIVDGVMAFNDAGRMIDQTFAEMPAKYTGIPTDAYVVMPNHVHGIILIDIDSPVGAIPRGCPSFPGPNLFSKQFSITFDSDEGRPRGAAPTDVKRWSLSDIVQTKRIRTR